MEINGLTFRPLTKTQGGQIIQSQPTSQTTINHIQHTKSILSSPPKNHQYVPCTSDQGQVDQKSHVQSQPIANQTVRYATIAQQQQPGTATQQKHQNLQRHHCLNIDFLSPPDTTTQHLLDNLSDKINHCFLLVEGELKEEKQRNTEQREWNKDIILRMNYIEDMTASTDSEVDTILSKLDSWDIPTKRHGVTSNKGPMLWRE